MSCMTYCIDWFGFWRFKVFNISMQKLILAYFKEITEWEGVQEA